MKLQELRNLISEEIRKVLKEESLQWVGKKNGYRRVWKDSQYHYTVVTDTSGQYKFIVFQPDTNKVVDSFFVKKDFNKIKSSPYYEAYKEIRDRWNQGPYDTKNDAFGY